MKKPSKGGRPTKDMVLHSGTVELESLAVDPTWSNEMAMIYGQILRPDPSDDSLKFAGVMTALMIANAPVEVLTNLFREILNMKIEVTKGESEKHRNWHVLRGYLDFRKAHGFKPSKAKLKTFLLENATTYKSLPDKADGKGWTRVFQAIGYDWLK